MFQKSVEQKYLNELDQELIDQKYLAFQDYFGNPAIQENIRNSKEEQFQEGFLRELFVSILGYTLFPQPDFNLTTELKNIANSKKADGAILKGADAVAVIELKGTDTTDLDKIEAQAFGYKNHNPKCVYVITSNFEKLRFYIQYAVEHLDFDLFRLSREQFALMWLCLSKENLLNGVPLKIKESSLFQEENITKKLYADYSRFRTAMYNNLTKKNPETDKLLLFKKTQKLLDRFLFILFAEDRLLLPPNSISEIVKQWIALKEDMDVYVPLYDRFKKYFGYMNTGYIGKKYEIYAYNGGLFAPDELLDSISIDDEILYEHTLALSNYNYETEVDVNTLGHIFEHSLGEIESVQAEIKGEKIDHQKTKRKKDGIFYTPKYITKYIVEHTVGKLCEEKRTELGIIDEEYAKGRKNRKKETLSALDKKLEAYRQWLLSLTILDPACGSGAFLNQALDFLITEHQKIDELRAQLLESSLFFSYITTDILEKNIYGVDINEESVEIAKLSLWLRTAQKGRKLNTLSNNIKCGNSLIDDPEIAGEKAFNWQNEFPEIFANGGFDVVIGNPPYIQLQKEGGKLAQAFEHQGFSTFERTGDIYSLFYEKGIQLLKINGLLTFITSNKWMRAGYGKSTRNFFCQHNPLKLIDLGSGIFESATVDTNILIIQKCASKPDNYEVKALDISKEKNISSFESFDNRWVTLTQLSNDSWTIASDIEQGIKAKIERIGKPLREWDIQINYGIKTGFNEAFIIDGKKKDELIAQDPKSAEIIKPILRGRDIKRYKAEFADLWLINSHNGIKGKLPKVNVVKDYPAIYKHLQQYEKQLVKRQDQGDHWTNLRNCAYIQEFEKEKIIYPNMTLYLPFIFNDKGYFINDKGYILSSDYFTLKFLVGYLNSKIAHRWIRKNCPELQGGTRELRKIFFENIPVPHLSNPLQQPFIDLVDKVLEGKENGLDTTALEQQIDLMVYRLYELTYEEVKVIDPEFKLIKEAYERIQME
mgnify:FL=1